MRRGGIVFYQYLIPNGIGRDKVQEGFNVGGTLNNRKKQIMEGTTNES